jgi:hypothetical protein
MSEVQVPIPGFDYSRLQINIPDTYVGEDGVTYSRPYEEVIDDAARVVKLLTERLKKAPVQQQPAQQAQRESQPEAKREAAASTDREEMLKESWGDCPDCGTAARPSLAKYQEWEEDEGGNEVPAKHFCPNRECGRKSLWRRELDAPASPF